MQDRPRDDTAELPPIRATDSYGRDVEVPREHWRTVVLPSQLQQAWFDPARLWRVIMDAHGDGFSEELREPSARMLEIDPDVERSHVLRAVILLGLGNREAAENILYRAESRIGATARILLQFARVHAAWKRTDKVKDHLWRALEKDPNLHEALSWWTDLHEAPAQKREALLRIAALQDSWAALLYLARLHLDNNEQAAALDCYERILQQAPSDSDALISVADELEARERWQDLAHLVAPRYSVARDNARIGVHLVRAYLKLEMAVPGLPLLEELFGLGIPALSQVLIPLSQAFDPLRPPLPSGDAPIDPQNIGIGCFDRPLWLLSAYDMAWAMHDVPRGKKIAMLALTVDRGDPADAASDASAGQEGDLGVVSRAIPLYLSEIMYFGSSLECHALIPYAMPANLVLFGAEESEEQLRAFADGYDYVLQGTVRYQADAMVVRLRLRAKEDLAMLAEFTRILPHANPGRPMLELADEIADRLVAVAGGQRTKPAWCQPPPADAAVAYLSALNQSLIMTLTRTPDDRAKLWGERHLLHWMQGLAASLQEHEGTQFIFFTALAKMQRAGSPLVREFERGALARLRELQEAKLFSARLAPMAFAMFRRREEFEWAATNDFAFEPGYAAWCDRVAHAVLADAP